MARHNKTTDKTDTYFIKIKKLKGDYLGIAARHNKRTILKELGTHSHIDSKRTCLNYSIAGLDTPLGITKRARELMAAADIGKLRKDAVKAIEVVFSLPVNTAINHFEYFEKCLGWCAGGFAGAKVLAADVHLDEAAPHCHVLLLPLIDGAMNGSELVGNKPVLAAKVDDFFNCVASHYGLSKPPKKLSTADLNGLYEQVIAHVRLDNPAALSGVYGVLLRESIRENPTMVAQLLGIEIAQQKSVKPPRSFTEIFTSRGAGAKTEKEQAKTNRFLKQKSPAQPMNTDMYDKNNPVCKTESSAKNEPLESSRGIRESLSCVGFAHSSPLPASKRIPSNNLDYSQEKESLDLTSKKVLELTARAWLENDTTPTEKDKDDTPAVNPNHTTRPIYINPIESNGQQGFESESTAGNFTESTTREREGSILSQHWDFEAGIFNNPPPAKQSVKDHYAREVRQAIDELHQSH
jgi:hypothetical protein